jgi:hypothetical protein
MKVQTIVMTAALVLAAAGAFAFKSSGKRVVTVYGKIDFQCVALCSTTPGFLCVKGSDDGSYYGQPNCVVDYNSIRYVLPGD